MNATSPQQIRFLTKQLDLFTAILTEQFGAPQNADNWDYEARPFFDGVRFEWLSQKGQWMARRYPGRIIR
jgi:hypothetical protein